MEQTFFPVTRREAERSGVQYDSKKNKNAGFPSRLRELRKGKGVSQDVVSKELGVSKSTLGLWETGDTLPDAKAICDLSSYYGVSADYLLGKTRFPTADINTREICEHTGLSEDAVKELQKHYATDMHDVVLLVVNNLLADKGKGKWQAYVRQASRYWAKYETSKDAKDPKDTFADHTWTIIENCMFPVASRDKDDMVKIPAKDASRLYFDFAVKEVNAIVVKSIEEYREKIKTRYEEILNSPPPSDEELERMKNNLRFLYDHVEHVFNELFEDSATANSSNNATENGEGGCDNGQH